MAPELVVPIIVGVVTGTLAIVGSIWGKAIDRKTSSEQAARETLDEVWEQRVTYRDEQIAGLKAQVAELTTEVRRLVGLVTKLGGTP